MYAIGAKKEKSESYLLQIQVDTSTGQLIDIPDRMLGTNDDGLAAHSGGVAMLVIALYSNDTWFVQIGKYIYQKICITFAV